MSLNPRVVTDPTGTWLLIDEDETSHGTYVYRDGKQISRTFDPSKTKIRLEKAGVPPRPGVVSVRMVEDIYLGVDEVANGGDPDPDPNPGQFGELLRAAFPPITPSQVIDDTGKPARTSVVLCDGANAGGKWFKKVRRVGGTDGYKVAGSAHDVRFDLCSGTDLGKSSGLDGQGFSFQRSPSKVQVYGGVYSEIGSETLEHFAYHGGGSTSHLFAGVLAHGFYGYGAHVYPGPSASVAYVHSTLVNSKQRASVIVAGESGAHKNVLFVGCILEDIVLRGDHGTPRFYRCCISGDHPSEAQYDECIFEDPQLDANFKPRNPKLLAGGNPGWVPPWDAYGNPYTRATIGAVAA